MEAELKTTYPDSNIQLVRGSDGVFTVKCDDTLVYSKKNTGRFPDAGEVSGLIEKKAGA